MTLRDLKTPMTAIIKPVTANLKTLSKAKDGIAAIEFALIAPLMIAMYFGVTEIALGIIADREVSHATNVAADLATQVASLDKADVEDIMLAALAVAAIPSDKIGDVSIELNSYRQLSDGTREQIGYARLGPEITVGGSQYDVNQLTNRLLSDTSGAVVARINYKYEPLWSAFLSDITLNETFVLKPRQSLDVPFEDGGSSSFICSANADYVVSC